jgi:hypothetical protein
VSDDVLDTLVLSVGCEYDYSTLPIFGTSAEEGTATKTVLSVNSVLSPDGRAVYLELSCSDGASEILKIDSEALGPLMQGLFKVCAQIDMRPPKSLEGVAPDGAIAIPALDLGVREDGRGGAWLVFRIGAHDFGLLLREQHSRRILARSLDGPTAHRGTRESEHSFGKGLARMLPNRDLWGRIVSPPGTVERGAKLGPSGAARALAVRIALHRYAKIAGLTTRPFAASLRTPTISEWSRVISKSATSLA